MSLARSLLTGLLSAKAPQARSAATRFLANRTQREILLLAALACLLAVWVALGLVWAPLAAWRDEVAARLPRIEKALALAPTLAPAIPPDPRPLPALVTETALPLGLSISSVASAPSSETADQVDLALDAAGFDTLLLWIEALERDHGLRLTELTLTRGPDPGIVAARLRLGR